MKRIIYFFILIAFSKLHAQSGAPPKINYQGVARDASGTPITVPIDLHFIISNNANNTVHDEIQSTIQPNTYGIFNTQIGLVTALSPTIGWQTGPYTLSVSIKISSSSTFTYVGAQQLVSVPFALYAERAGNALPTATVNGSTLRWDASLPGWKVDTNIVNNGNRVNIGNRYAIPNNKFAAITNNGSDSAAVFGFHKNATDGFAGVRGIAAGSSLPTSSLNATGILGGHFVGANLVGQGIGVLGQGHSEGANGIGLVAIGSSNSTNLSNNYAVGLYATTDPTCTTQHRFAGVFENGNVFIRDTLQLNIPGSIGAVLTRTTNGKAIWQSMPTATATGSGWSLSGNGGTTAGTDFLGTTDGTDLVVKTNSIERMRLFNGGGLSIGNVTGLASVLSVSGPVSAPSYGHFSIRSNGAASVNQAFMSFVSDGPSAIVRGILGDFSTSDADIYLNASNNLRLGAGVANTIVYINGTNKNVGIGTTNPTENVQIESATGTNLSIIGGGNTVPGLLFGDAGLHAKGKIEYDNLANSMNIWTNNTPNRIFIDNSGNVGLKTVSTSGHDLNIFNPGNNTSIKMTNNFTASFGLVLSINNAATNIISYENTPFNLGNNSTTFLSAQPNGNVGIGSTAPAINSRLAIKDGHLQSQQSAAPSIVGNNNASAQFWNGNSTDVTGIIEISIGSSPLPGTQATVTFNKPYNSVPMVIITPMNNNYAAKAVANCEVFVTATTGGFKINFNSAYPLTSTTMYFNYIVMEGN